MNKPGDSGGPTPGPALLERLPLLFLELDGAGKVVGGPSGGIAASLSLSAGECHGRTLPELIPGFREHGAVLEAALSGERGRFEGAIGPRVFDWTIEPRAGGGATLAGLDITELRATKSDLSVREEQLRLLVDTALDAVVTCDARSVIIDWNAEAEQLFGWKREEAIGLLLTDTIIPEDLRAAHAAGMRRYLDSGEGPVLGRRIEIEAVDRSGRRFPIELGINPIPTSTGLMFSAFLREITERVRQEQRLIGSEYRLRSALSAMEAGAWDFRLSPEAQLVEAQVDDRVAELLGNDAHVLPLERESILPEDRPLVERAWREHVGGNAPRYAVDYRRKASDGSVVWRREVGIKVADEASQEAPDFAGQLKSPFRVIGVVTDLTPAKSMEASLVDSRKLEAAGLIASQFAHDLNNVLTAISGHATIVELDQNLSERARDSIAVLKDAVARGGALTQNMLMVGRPVKGRRAQVDLARLVEDTARLARPILGTDIELSSDLEPGLPGVFLDANQLQQAILNLLINSRDAMGRHGKVRIDARRFDEAGGRVAVSVVDDGPGMPPEVLENATKAFFTTKGDKGTGLGLAMIKRMVDTEDGEMLIESELGRGTTIRLVFPASSAPTAGASRKPIRRVLIVEDHPLLRPMLSEALSNAGCTVEACGDGDAATGIASSFKPDLVVLDVNLPGRRGDEVAMDLRKRLGVEVPVLFVTGNNDFEVPDWRNVDLVRKPFELTDFTRRVLEFSVD